MPWNYTLGMEEWGGVPEGGFPPKGVVAALPTTPME